VASKKKRKGKSPFNYQEEGRIPFCVRKEKGGNVYLIREKGFLFDVIGEKEGGDRS